jgi:hypothetical protein
MKRALIDDFWSHVRIGGEDECWPWQAGCDKKGYGVLRTKAPELKLIKAHRHAYELAHGQINEELDVLHTCDNPPCCNARHLYQGTNDDNVRDMHERGRNKNPPHDIYPHPRSKLKPEQVKEIFASTEPSSLLAKRYGVHRSAIKKIRRRETWEEITCAMPS